MLMSLLSGQRIQTLHLVDIRNIEFRGDTVIVRVTELVKQTRPGYHLPEITFPSYNDKTLCVVTTLRVYLEVTRKLRKNQTKLFISHVKPYGPVSKATIGRWVKTTMYLAGIDTSIFKPHSVRSASVSRAHLKNVPLNTILKTAGWSNSCTFRKFYNKPCVNNTQYGEAILD